MIYTALREQNKVKIPPKGFTIVELIVVIVVIGILAAITVVSYGAVTENARQQTVATDAQGIAAALTKYRAEKGAYPSDISQLEWKPEGGSTFQYAYDATTRTYCVTASVEGASAYVVSGGSTVKEGGCAGHGVNGKEPITNLASDPAATRYTTPNTAAGWRNDRYGANGTYSLVTGAGDGPVSGISTYARMEFTTAISAGRGFHFTGNPEGSTPGVNGMPVEEGKTYTLSAYLRSARTSGGTVSFSIGARFVNSAGAWIGATSQGTAVTAAAGSPTTNPGPWVRPSLTVTAPAGAVRVQAYVREAAAPTHAVGDRIEGTGLLITQGSQLYGYADGTFAGWKWNGGAHTSPSVGPER